MQYWGHVVGVRMQGDMRSYVFTHLQKLPNSYFNNNKTGVIMSRIINDLMEVSELAHHGPEDLFISIVMFLGSFFILIGINVELTLIVFTILPIIVIYAISQRKRMNKAFKETRVKTGDVNATLENSIAGMKVTKSFCTEKEELEKFNESNQIFKKAREGAYKVMAQYFSGMFLLIDILELIVLIVAGYFTYMGYITIGDFTAYLLYVKMFIQPLRKLINFTEQYQNGMTGFERFMEIINEETEKEPENPIELENIKGNIESSVQQRNAYIEEVNKIKENIDENCKGIYIISIISDDTEYPGFKYFVMRYELIPIKFNYDEAYSITTNKERVSGNIAYMSYEQLKETIFNNYDYVYINDVDEEFKEEYGELFNYNVKKHNLYKVQENKLVDMYE